jgi:hypothetical protein
MGRDLAWKEVKCIECGREFICTPTDDYYGDTPTSGRCEKCHFASNGIPTDRLLMDCPVCRHFYHDPQAFKSEDFGPHLWSHESDELLALIIQGLGIRDWLSKSFDETCSRAQSGEERKRLRRKRYELIVAAGSLGFN